MAKTIEELLRAGLAMRGWCFACAVPIELRREDLADYWHLELGELAIFCPACRRTDDVIALPAAAPAEPEPEPEDNWPLTTTDIVSFIFHQSRSRAKKRRRRF